MHKGINFHRQFIQVIWYSPFIIAHGDLHLHVHEPPMAISISMYGCPRGDLHLHAIVSTTKCYIRYYAITN